jgi:hypothetical protein
MCFSSFMRDMKVFMDHYLNLGRWQPQYLRGVKAKSTMRGGMRQIARCVRRTVITTAPKCLLVFNPLLRPANLQRMEEVRRSGTGRQAGTLVNA